MPPFEFLCTPLVSYYYSSYSAVIVFDDIRACKALGHPYVLQLGRIYLDMLNVYKVMSENITAAITHNGELVS